MSTITLLSTVKDAKEWLRARLLEGAECPVCAQRVQMYRRSVTSTMARGIILMYRAAPDGSWFHLPSVHVQAGGGDDTKFAYWGLIEEEMASRPDGGRAGWWRLTPDGMAFARGELTIPKYALVYNGKCLGVEGDEVSIRDCLGKKFDLRELLNGG